jgi:hypothetical protein
MSIYLGNTAIGNGNYLGNLNIRYSNIFMSQSVVAPVDPDAAAFITATGISGSNATAINTLVVTLKTDSLWTKMAAVYPFIGGTADSNKYNLIDPQNTNGAYRLTYVTQAGSSITHSASGFEVKNSGGNGAYADTYIAPNPTVTLGSEHMSIYVNSNNTQTNGDPVPIGTLAVSETSLSLIVTKGGADQGANVNKFLGRMNSQGVYGSVSTTQAGFFLITKNSTTLSLYRNGGTVEASGTSGGTLPTSNIWIGALNIFGSPYGATWTRFATVTYGDGLTYDDSVNLYDAIQAYNTSLGRQY